MRPMYPRGLRAMLAVSAAVVLSTPAAAKDFRPGDVRICAAGARCAPVRDPNAAALLAEMYYGPESPPHALAPRPGARTFELRFRNGYVTGIVSTARLDRFLSYGVNLGHFRPGGWYVVPDVAATELRKLSAGMQPLALTPAMVARSR